MHHTFNSLVVESVNESTLSETISFLRKHENYSLVLLGILFHPKHTLHSGNLKQIRIQGMIVAVFFLTKRSTLIIHSESSDLFLLESILAFYKEERPILGLMGEWDCCSSFWNLLKEQQKIRTEHLASRQILYTLSMAELAPPENKHIRLLAPDDFSQWLPLRKGYFKEQHLPQNFSDDEMHEHFLEKVQGNMAWGYFLDKTLIAVADFNAKAFGLAEVGGVYTSPAHRRKGIARSVMLQLIKDAKDLHGIHKLVIYTAETNLSARRLYESLPTRIDGYYAIMFGNHF